PRRRWRPDRAPGARGVGEELGDLPPLPAPLRRGPPPPPPPPPRGRGGPAPAGLLPLLRSPRAPRGRAPVHAAAGGGDVRRRPVLPAGGRARRGPPAHAPGGPVSAPWSDAITALPGAAAALVPWRAQG